eukprot:TRINITY_DN3087_c1_g1_i1.p6 TRINITY_DN3087_c1_g1~~TRINITY_DN3087_c1_g1_i1.p6  ORF type:complete len:168 (+),score=3.79 TRINITY_DN3087_c1_g1_i1:1074-1577(+)
MFINQQQKLYQLGLATETSKKLAITKQFFKQLDFQQNLLRYTCSKLQTFGILEKNLPLLQNYFKTSESLQIYVWGEQFPYTYTKQKTQQNIVRSEAFLVLCETFQNISEQFGNGISFEMHFNFSTFHMNYVLDNYTSVRKHLKMINIRKLPTPLKRICIKKKMQAKS